jgi:hypothetical protein
MKTAVSYGIAALATAGAAVAGEPMVLTDAQLDQVTAGFLKVEIHVTILPIQDGTSNTALVTEAPPASGGTSAPRKPAEFVIISIGQKINHALPPGER